MSLEPSSPTQRQSRSAEPPSRAPGAMGSEALDDARSTPRHWNHVYETRRVDTLSWTAPHLSPSLTHVDALRTAGTLDPGAPIVDVGAGASTFVQDLLARGHTDVTALDISSRALAVARAQLDAPNDRVRFVQGDVRDVQLPARSVALWHDRATFHFMTTTDDLQRYRRALHRALAHDGHALVWTFAAGGPSRCSALPTQRYSAQELAAALKLQLVHGDTYEHRTPRDDAQRFTVALLRRFD